MGTEQLSDILKRLEHERLDADRRYNEALSALDRACLGMPDLPPVPAVFDGARLPDLNRSWDTFEGGGLKQRVRRWIWKIIGQPVLLQHDFNAQIVDHLNRQAEAQQQTEQAVVRTLDALRDEFAHFLRFQNQLIVYLQSVTAFVDTRDRSTASWAHVLNGGISALSDDWMQRWESLAAREARIMARLDSVADIRAVAAVAQQTAVTLKQDVERALARFAAPPTQAAVAAAAPAVPAPLPESDLDASRYLAFENAFRGSLADISDRLADYLPRFEGLGDVLDIGCGRGEFVALLGARGVRTRGIDANPAMVDHARRRGLDVEHADALAYVESLPDASLGGVFSSQVVEHLDPPYLTRLVDAIGRKLRPGGIVVLETINPSCWVAFFESYIRDLTHVRPLHPETMQHMLHASGFTNVSIEYRSPVPETERLQRVVLTHPTDRPEIDDLVGTFNENVELINRRLFSYQDYAVTGHR